MLEGSRERPLPVLNQGRLALERRLDVLASVLPFHHLRGAW